MEIVGINVQNCTDYQQEHQQVVILNNVKDYNLPQITLS